MCLIDDIIASPREDADHSSVGDKPVESPKLVAVGGGESPKEDLFGEPIASESTGRVHTLKRSQLSNMATP